MLEEGVKEELTVREVRQRRYNSLLWEEGPERGLFCMMEKGYVKENDREGSSQ